MGRPTAVLVSGLIFQRATVVSNDRPETAPHEQGDKLLSPARQHPISASLGQPEALAHASMNAETHAVVFAEQAFAEERRGHTVNAEPHVFPACRFRGALASRFRRGDHDEMRRCPPALNKLRKVFESVGTVVAAQ